jgi:hypothetical protein
MIDWCLMPTLAVFQLYRVVLPLKQISNFTDREWLYILVLLVSKQEDQDAEEENVRKVSRNWPVKTTSLVCLETLTLNVCFNVQTHISGGGQNDINHSSVEDYFCSTPL